MTSGESFYFLALCDHLWLRPSLPRLFPRRKRAGKVGFGLVSLGLRMASRLLTFPPASIIMMFTGESSQLIYISKQRIQSSTEFRERRSHHFVVLHI